MEKVEKKEVALSGDAAKIWDEVKDRTIDPFAVPGQTVKDHVNPLPVSDKELYVTLRSTAVLPALEAALGNKFSVEQNTKYIVISRANS